MQDYPIAAQDVDPKQDPKSLAGRLTVSCWERGHDRTVHLTAVGEIATGVLVPGIKAQP
jgi:hypothetical protein